MSTLFVESIVYLSAFYFIIQGTLREYSAGIIILTFLIDFIVINVVLKTSGAKEIILNFVHCKYLGFYISMDVIIFIQYLLQMKWR